MEKGRSRVSCRATIQKELLKGVRDVRARPSAENIIAEPEQDPFIREWCDAFFVERCIATRSAHSSSEHFCATNSQNHITHPLRQLEIPDRNGQYSTFPSSRSAQSKNKSGSVINLPTTEMPMPLRSNYTSTKALTTNFQIRRPREPFPSFRAERYIDSDLPDPLNFPQPPRIDSPLAPYRYS